MSKEPRRLFISFSGGETSALMTRLLLTKWRDRYDEIAVVFANTGQENNETLDFVKRCDDTFKFGTVWVECEISKKKGTGTRHRIVNHRTASRDGRPFEDYIRKYGIPNAAFKDCTRELKLNPLRSYLKDELGWKTGTYETAIGIRADEPERRSAAQASRRLVYPLLDWLPTTKPQVNTFWREQPFRLQLAGYQGNCKWCWKKSNRKLLTIMGENPEFFDFPERMERKYGKIGAEFQKARTGERPPLPAGYRRTFFRGNIGARDLRKLYEQTKDTLDVAENDAVVYEGKLIQLDVEPSDGAGCTESCEVTFDESGEE